VTADTDHRLALHHAAVLLGSHRAAQAAAIVAPVLGRDPENVAAWLLMTRIRLVLHDDEGALHAAGTAVALAPGIGYPLALAGLALSSLGRHDEAVSTGKQALSTDPDDPFLQNIYARLVLSAGGDPAEAQRAARVAVALDPADPDHHVTLGVALGVAGRPAPAREALLTALRLDPQHAEARHQLAIVDAEGRNPLAITRLAGAASGFAAALRSDPREQASRFGLDMSLRTFLIRTSWLLLVLCGLAARFASTGNTGWARALGVAGVGATVAFAGRFVAGLDLVLRRYLWSLLSAGRQRRAAVGAVLSAVLMLSAAVAPTSWVYALSVSGALGALLVRITTTAESNDHARAAGVPVPYVLGSVTLSVIGLLTGLIGLFLLAVGLTEGRWQATVGAAALLAVTGYLVRTVIRRLR
jgi:tetratricopeptide (TPR) repeat protein